MYLDVLKENQGGFNFDLCLRNNILIDKNVVSKPKFTSTGTTIYKILFKNDVIWQQIQELLQVQWLQIKIVKNCINWLPIYIVLVPEQQQVYYIILNLDNDWVTKKM